jgi:nucleoside-diphosphate-sugar epimerase
MRVLVIGGTGFLGSHLVPKLIGNGHQPTVLTRSAEKAARLEANGVKVIIGDLLQPDSFLPRLTPQDLVISIAMPEMMKPKRITRRRFLELRDTTTAFFKTSFTVAEKLGCPLVATLGTSFRTKGDEVADESWPIERFGAQKIGELVDPMIEEARKCGRPPLILMLPGQIYGPGGMFLKMMYQRMKEGKGGIIGSGENFMPRIHVDDCADAYIKVLEKMPVGESFIVADDSQCTTKEFMNAMADFMEAPRPKSVPGLPVRLIMGKLLYETITMNCRVSNAKLKRLGWKPNYPTYKEGLPATITEIEKGR